MSEDTIIFPQNAESNPGFKRVDSIISPKELKKRFLFGIPLKAADGSELDHDDLAYYITSAISIIEHQLNVTITPTIYKEEPHDYRAEDYDAWFWLKLRHRPMFPDPELVTVNMQYINGQTLISLPKKWYRIYANAAQVQMTPTSGTMGQFYISQSGAILPGVWGSKKDYPQLIKVTYTAGFEEGKVPIVFNHLIGYRAAIDVLEIMRDAILGIPGVGSYSIGLDGLNQSLSKDGFEARIASYKDKVLELSSIVKSYYSSFTFATT